MSAPSTFEIGPYAAFRRQLPHELTPTNLDGAFTTPAPPAGFDYNTATGASLAKQGVFLRRPDSKDSGKAAAAWQKVFSREWRPEDRVIPHLEPQIGVIHKKRKVRKTDAGFSSNNW